MCQKAGRKKVVGANETESDNKHPWAEWREACWCASGRVYGEVFISLFVLLLLEHNKWISDTSKTKSLESLGGETQGGFLFSRSFHPSETLRVLWKQLYIQLQSNVRHVINPSSVLQIIWKATCISKCTTVICIDFWRCQSQTLLQIKLKMHLYPLLVIVFPQSTE